MLYVFHGSDLGTARKKANALADALRTRKPDAAFVKIGEDEWSPSVLEEHIGGQGLFSNKYIVLLDRLSGNAEATEKVSEFIPAMAESPNIFIVLEGRLSAAQKKLLEAHAEKTVACEAKVAVVAGRGDFNVFALGDALGYREPVKAWMLYRQAIEAGLEPENVSGTLFWQVKSMLAARSARSAGEAGLNPFTYSKSKRYSANYSPAELAALATRLVTLYHDGHRGLVNLEYGLERLLLDCGKSGL